MLSNFQPVFVDVSECELRSTDQSMLSLTFIWDQSFTRDPSFVFTYYANPRRETKDLMNFKVTKKAKSFIGNIFKLLKKSFGKIAQDNGIIVRCYAGLPSDPLLLSL